MHCDWLQKVTGHKAMCQGLRETACQSLTFTFLRSRGGALPSVSHQGERCVHCLGFLGSSLVQEGKVTVRHDLRLWPLDFLKDESKVTVISRVVVEQSDR